MTRKQFLLPCPKKNSLATKIIKIILLIINNALQVSESFNSVINVAEDIDILIVLTARGRRHCNVYFLKPKEARSIEQCYNTSSFMHGNMIAKDLFLHGFFRL